MHFDIFNRKTISTDNIFFETTLNPKQAMIIGKSAKIKRWFFLSTNFATLYVIILSVISILLIHSNSFTLIGLLLALLNLMINRLSSNYWKTFFRPNAEYGKNHRPAVLPILYIVTLFGWLWSMNHFVAHLTFLSGAFVLIGVMGSLLSLWVWMNLNTISCIPISEMQWRTNAKRRGVPEEEIEEIIAQLKKRRATYFNKHDK
ncbi:hypothetical protein [uncultured Lactobacillus sp.]|uniref:hypothetical protein n=1 Tax=uncultured Lactobacillus sp. TaxID=153152 RepID=UPI002626829B|nr:hypothetical protein [uncultured Lactobacillus sp.]